MIELESDRRDEGSVVAVRGRLDLVGARPLRDHLAEVLGAGPPLVVLDLGATEFMDSSGLGAVVAGLKAARERGGDLRLANVTGQVQLVLELTKLDRVLRPYESVEAALRGRS